jgi:3-isopropylmalate/(R)-2-methylmalate dehydratase large subunit
MATTLFRREFGRNATVRNPAGVFAFRDHLTFLQKVMPEEQKMRGLLVLADNLAVVQKEFIEEQGIRLFGESPDGGSEAICHNAVLEELAAPGQLIIGTDSHTCTAGALGCFAFGVGSTDIANAWYTGDVQVIVPSTVQFILEGKPTPDVCAKDIMLYVMSHDYIRSGQAIGKVLEFSGSALQYLNVDERATLTNMAVEAGATTGIIAADDVVVEYLQKIRGLTREQATAGILSSDPDAQFDGSFTFDLSELRPMVATPGDPRNGVVLAELVRDQGEIAITIAYGGSCTGGKMTDMDMYAEVLAEGLKRGKKVKAGVDMYIQFGSKRIKRYAESMGYLDIFEEAGAKVLEPSCGACINAGPGVSQSKEQVSVSAINRNFPGRSGPGQVYLASPRVVAASALAGKLISPEDYFGSSYTRASGNG